MEVHQKARVQRFGVMFINRNIHVLRFRINNYKCTNRTHDVLFPYVEHYIEFNKDTMKGHACGLLMRLDLKVTVNNLIKI